MEGPHPPIGRGPNELTPIAQEENPMPADFVLVPATAPGFSGAAVSSTFFFDPLRVRNLLGAAADSGFDAIVVDDAGGPLTNVDIAADVARLNRQLDVILTHWAAVTSPVVAASDFASLDRCSGGRLSLRVLSGESGANGFPGTWKRTDEYLTLLKRLWSNDRPIDHEGLFYRLRHALVADKGQRGHEIPIRMSGSTGTEIAVAARHATVFELPQAHPDRLAGQIGRVAAAAARCGRPGKVSFSARLHVCGKETPDRSAWLSACISAGVTEFMVSGLNDAAAIERFGTDVIDTTRSLRIPGAEVGAVPLMPDQDYLWLADEEWRATSDAIFQG